MNRRFLKALAFTVLAIAPAAMAFPQSLADAAKKEQARRKRVPPKAAAKVYTESDLPSAGTKDEASDSDGTAGTDKTGAAPSASGAASGTGAAPAARSDSAGASATDMKERQAEAYKARIAALKEQIAEQDKVVERLAKHPTGGGKICKIPEGVFKPGQTAPEQVVCPYQMESRYDRAKRQQDKMKADLAALESEARRAGVVIR